MTVLADHFQARWERPPSGTWFAPGRVNLIGEHTDYNDGFVLPFALDKRTLVAAAPASGRTRVVSRNEPGDAEFDTSTVAPGDVPGWAAYVAGVAWALREAGHPVPDADLLVESDVPVGAGLSSSAALECAVAVALTDLAGITLDRTAIAKITRRAENEFVGAPTGGMDQMAAMHGKADMLVFLDTRDDLIERVPFRLARYGLALLVIDTQAPHAHAGGQYGERRADCAAAAEALGVPALRDATVADLDRISDPRIRRRARHVVTEDDRVRQVVDLLSGGVDPRAIGPVLDASHASMRDDFEITVPHVDVAAACARSAGAHGARMTGGGFGGCVIALCDDGDVAGVTTAVEKAYAERGWTAPVAFTAVPSAGAARLE
ncbi:galactokinase [Pseudonocardia endophytica]|uniref:Galactokinase n=1 Tax=Pseudonocardia endophytica TaxID=401976 RepID=A0A4R1HLN2_PSEEN|nr:galactokinase [Pseudonocardia endophytica]TCK22898.1 galactokinase [Pseudonocardia endophytica]